MVKILKLIDIFPQNFTFTYKGRKNLRTNWGGIISIFAFLAILINAYLIGKDIYFKEKPNVILINDVEKFTPTFRINQNTTKLGFSISLDIDLLEYKSFLNIIPFFHIHTLNKNNSVIQRNYFFEMEKCKKNPGDSYYYDQCIKDMDFYLAGSWTEDHMAYLGLFVQKCSNATTSILPETNIKTEEDNKIMDEFERNINNYQQSELLGDKEYNKGLNLYDHLR